MLRIITDSSAEITQEEAAELGIRIVPLSVVFGGESFREGVDLPKDEFYNRLVAGEFPHSSMPSTEDFSEAFSESTEETLVILISSALSGTVNTARLAARDGEFTNVHVYDSHATTCLLRIMVETAYRNREKSAEEVMEVLDRLRPRLHIHAYLDTLEFLYKGGRIKKGVAIVGGLLGIKPLITFTQEGAVVMDGREHGRKKAIRALVKTLNSAKVDPEYPVYFMQTNTDEFTRAVMKETGREGDRIFRICCAVGTHIGPNAAGYVYVEKE